MATRRSTMFRENPPARDATAPSARVSRSPTAPTRLALTPEARRTMIAEGAYLRAERVALRPVTRPRNWLAAKPR